MIRYFVCHRFRCCLDDNFIRNFYEKGKYSKLYQNKENAKKALREAFYDDEDYAVIKVINSKTFKRV